MKKICLLLIIALCLSTCACADISDVTGTSSAEASNDASKETSQTAVCEAVLKIDALLAGDIPDRTAVGKNMLLGKQYTFSRVSGENGTYADTDAFLLTDGVSSEQFSTYSWVGFAGGEPVSVDFDLGDDAHGIADIDIGCLKQLDYGIGLPLSATLYASTDGDEYTSLGTIYTPTTLSECEKYTYAFHLNQALKARYIRISFFGAAKRMVFYR